MLTKYRGKFSVLMKPLVIPFIKLKLNPNVLTIMGLIFSIVFLIMVISLSTNFFLIIITYLLAILFDYIDGAVAKFLHRTTKWGSFLDSFTDRVSDAIFIYSLIYFNIPFHLVILELVGAYLISYARAKGESLGIKMESIGIAERAERLILILVIILLFKWAPLASLITFYILLALTYITVIQRVYHIRKALLTS